MYEQLIEALESADRDIRDWLVTAQGQRQWFEGNHPAGTNARPCPTIQGLQKSDAVLRKLQESLKFLERFRDKPAPGFGIEKILYELEQTSEDARVHELCRRYRELRSKTARWCEAVARAEAELKALKEEHGSGSHPAEQVPCLAQVPASAGAQDQVAEDSR